MNIDQSSPAHHGFRPRAGRHLLRRLCIWVTVALAGVHPAFAGTWTKLTHTAPSTVGHMLLLSDGTVMAENNNDNGTYGPVWYRLTPDASGSYVNGTWTTLASMINTRLFFASQVLMDGRVFVAGGEYGTGGAAGEVYDPVANTWTAAPTPGHTFSDADSEILLNGNVLVALVEGSLMGTLIYNPTTNTWASGPTTHGIHNESAWMKLPDNSILFVDRDTTNSERYIPATNTWITDATVSVSLYDPYGSESGPGMLLPNGKVIFFGATGHNTIYTPSGSTANGLWVAAPDFPNGQAMPDAPCAMMPNGNILCATAPIPVSGNVFQSPTSFYEYNYVTNSFTQVNAPAGGTTESGSSFQRDMLLLPDGTVLSSRFTNQLYVYSGGGTPVAGAAPTVTSVTKNGNGSYHLVGTLLNGISEGAVYGDDNQDSTNRPIVRLTSGSNVYYVRTYNWSSTGVATGSASLTTEFTLPANVPFGTYSLFAVANGIASAAVSFTYSGLSVSPATGLASSGTIGGPFSPSSQIYTLTNNSTSSLNWTATTNQGWLSASPASGTLGAGANIQVTVFINSAANTLTTGSYSATASFTDVTNGPVITRSVTLTTNPERFLYFPLDTDPGWTRQGEWAFGTPTGGGGASHGNHDPTSGATGSNVFGINLNGDYSTTVGGPYYLTTGAISTTGYTGTQLRFKRWLNSDYPPYVDATIDVSSDGTNWTNLFANTSGVAIADSAWTTQTYTLGAAFDNKPAIYIRWGHQVGSTGSFAYSGWNIDDIEILGTPTANNATLLNLALSAGTLSPVFSSTITSYTASVPYATSSLTVTPTAAGNAATIKVNGATVTSGSPSGAISLAVGSNSIPTAVTAQDGVTTQTYTVNVTRLTNLQGWRQTYFGITSNSGNAANTADPDNDGLPNLLEFATNANPTVASPRPGAVVRNGSNLEFTYTRSDAAIADGVTFTVEWSDTLVPGSWSNAGVTENILSDNGTVQQVKDIVPIGTSFHRYVHLKVTSPNNN